MLCEDGFVYRNGECVSENKCVISGGTWDEATGKCTCPSDAPYDSATGGCVVKDMCSRVNVGGYGTIYVKNNSTVHLTKDCSDTAITSITVPTKTNAEYEGSYNNTSFTGSQCVYKNGKIDLINCPVTKANVVWSTKFTCVAGFQDLNGVCVASGTTKQIPIVVSNDIKSWVKANGVTFECSTAAETRISAYSTYATADNSSPYYAEDAASCIKACYQSSILYSTEQQTCVTMPANVCSDPNTKLYILVDEFCLTH